MDFFDAARLFLSVLILCGGAFFSFYLKGFFILHPIKTVKEMFFRKEKSGISPLRALSASLSGTLGVGNIAGVTVALILGGAGALFWIWVSALISMVLKYCEITLGVRYRKKSGKEYLGGPMMYMPDGIEGTGGRLCAIIFACAGVVCSFSLGNVVQMSAACDSASIIFGADERLFACAAALAAALVIWGGFHRISRVTETLLPLISGAYLIMCAAVIIKGREYLPSALERVLRDAFVFDSAAGGALGFLLSENVSQGTAKGTFSHESGSGTAPMAHANAQTDLPARQGLLGLFEVFADTVVMCTLSALVVLIGEERGICGENGMELTLLCFEDSLGPWSKYAVGAAIIFFALSTSVCWAFYGKTCLAYLSASKKARGIYVLLYLAFTTLASSLSQNAAWNAAEASILLMTAVNMPALFLLRRHIKNETKALFP